MQPPYSYHQHLPRTTEAAILQKNPRPGTIVNLIARATTAKGLTVRCRLDRRRYAVGTKVSAQDMAALNLCPSDFHGEWNYTIRPSQKTSL
jgi:hypothetical protein